ncbi:Leucine-rich repeat and calponin domain-containing 3 [Gossypium arboreum]|uniref:Leucine-rich repeat and calponin domain-containing 3 n=1 Tax=Gossypium arboreum TaxID=29729 RepID=A0A0B0N5I5_GOSAR|nr:Leucine-rich repeat and calponin domain-containing 3 [Gossypium arboreum]
MKRPPHSSKPKYRHTGIPKIIDSSDTRNVVSIPLIHDPLVPICFRFHRHLSFLNPDPMPLKSPTLYRQRVRCSVPLSRKMAPSSHSVPGP